MNFVRLRIGYVPASSNFSAPADRRRIHRYLLRRGLPFEIASANKNYDVIFLSQAADISIWERHDRTHGKIVYDLTDSYLSIPQTDWKGRLRGFAKFITRQNRALRLNYTEALRNMCRRADAVVCACEEQKREILKYCSNVHVILDVHSDLIKSQKTNYAAGPIFNIAWEGLAASNNNLIFQMMRDILRPLRRKYPIALHLLTDLRYGKYHGKYYQCDTYDDLRRIFGNEFKGIYLYQWNDQLFSSVASACDMAMIPIPLNHAFMAGKPENKLLLFWRLGIPTVVSATPAYERAMASAGLSMSCRTIDEWTNTLETYIGSESKRREAGLAGKSFCESRYSEEKLLEGWDKLLQSLT